jgi:hypothetical protein
MISLFPLLKFLMQILIIFFKKSSKVALDRSCIFLHNVVVDTPSTHSSSISSDSVLMYLKAARLSPLLASS